MQEWIVWLAVAAIGVAAAMLIHGLLRQSRGLQFIGVPIVGLLGAFLAAWLLPRLIEMSGLTLLEERLIWAAVGGLALTLIYELASAGGGSHRSRIIIQEQMPLRR